MKHALLIAIFSFSAVCLQAQRFNAADPVCEKAQLTMSGPHAQYRVFYQSNELDPQQAAELAKDVYLLSERTPFHTLKEPVLEKEIASLLHVWQDYQRQAIVQNGAGEFFVFFTKAAVTKTHLDRQCPAEGSWYALLLQGIPVLKNQALLKALQAENWETEVQKLIARKNPRSYQVLIEPLCAEAYGAENCMFVMKD